MQGLKLLLTVFTIVGIVIDQTLAQDFIKQALENLKRHKESDQYAVKYQQPRDDDDDDDDDDDSTRSVSPQNLGELIEMALQTQGVPKRTSRKEPNRKKKQYQPSYLDQLNKLGLNEFVIYDPDSARPIYTENQKDPLLTMLGSSGYNKAISEEENEKSPIYAIVKTDDLETRPDRNINDLVSSLLKSALSNQNGRGHGKKERRYKGFRVKDTYRRGRGDSNEKFESDGNEDKRPVISRPRSYGSGRTPIPYIRHRGDIYEKDG